MNNLIEEKIKLDIKIEKLLDDFAIKNKCGYNGFISVNIKKERVNNETIITSISKETNTTLS